MKLAPGWALIQIDFDPIQEIGLKVSGRSFTGLQLNACNYLVTYSCVGMGLYFRPRGSFSASSYPMFGAIREL